MYRKHYFGVVLAAGWMVESCIAWLCFGFGQVKLALPEYFAIYRFGRERFYLHASDLTSISLRDCTAHENF